VYLRSVNEDVWVMTKIPRPLNIGMVHNISETATTAARVKRIESVTELPGCYNV
jgi:hypothetical protein